MKKIFPLSLIVIITSALYANAVGGGFLRDDFPVIMENRWITGARYIPEIFSSTLWGFYEGSFISGPSNYYRPLMHMIYMAGYHIFGQSPAGYHLVNIVFHNLNAVLVFLIASLLLRPEGAAESGEHAGGAEPGFFGPAFFPLAAALIFAAHPVNVEAVAWVGAVSELAFTSFCLAAFYLYALEGKGSRRAVFYILSVVFYGLALFTKETAIVLPVLLAAYDFAVRKRPLTAAKRYIPYLAVAGVFFYIRSNIVGPLSTQHSMTAYQYMLSVAFLTAQYIEKLVFPFNLKLYYPFHRPQSLGELFSHEVFAALGAAAVLAFSLYRSSARGRLILCTLWVLIPLSPAVLMVKYIQGEWAFASRYLYLSSAGFAILCACWLKDLFEARPLRDALAPGRRKALMAALALLVIVPFAADTVIAARAWRDEFSYWKKAVEDAPGSPNTHASLGFAYAEKGLYEDAIREYEITLSIAPGSHETYMNLGAAYYNTKKPDKALEMFARALSLSKSEAAGRDIHARMGRIYLEKRMWTEAAQSLEEAVSGGGAGADLYNRLGIAYAQMGRIDMAVSAFREAVALDPGNAGAQRNLQMLLDSGAGSNATR